MKDEYCSCDENDNVYSETGDFGYWLRCCHCNKVIEDSLESYNHYDGEDHCDF